MNRNQEDWPPEGYEAVGEYAFTQPYVPTLRQVEDAEMFVFSQPEFLDIDEGQRRRNVIRLAIHAATVEQAFKDGVENQMAIILLIGDVVVIATSKLHEGTVVSEYEIQTSDSDQQH